MITLLLILLVAAVVLWATRALIAAFSIPDPIATVIYIIVVLVILLWFLGAVGIRIPGLR